MARKLLRDGLGRRHEDRNSNSIAFLREIRRRQAVGGGFGASTSLIQTIDTYANATVASARREGGSIVDLVSTSMDSATFTVKGVSPERPAFRIKKQSV